MLKVFSRARRVERAQERQRVDWDDSTWCDRVRRKIRDVSTLAKVASVLGFASALERDASIRDVNAVVAGTGQWWLTESNRATVHE